MNTMMKNTKEENLENIQKRVDEVILDKDVMCGLFDCWNGGGSIIGIEPEKDIEIHFRCIHRAEIDTGKSLYGCSIRDVYGFMGGSMERRHEENSCRGSVKLYERNTFQIKKIKEEKAPDICY